MTAGLHRAHHDLAGVDPDADLDAGAALPSQVLAPAAEIFARRERRVQCALRMVLVRDRCAEQREDAVAGRLHDVPVVAMDRVDHRLERGIDYGAGLLGIEVAHQLSRALDIREERGDGLALALEYVVRFEQRSFGYGRFAQTGRRTFNLGLRRRPSLKRCPAFLAEFCCRWIVEAASHAGRLESSPALNARFRGWLILGVAARTAHCSNLPSRELAVCLSRSESQCYQQSERLYGVRIELSAPYPTPTDVIPRISSRAR